MQPHKKYFFFDFDGTLTIGHTACVPPDTRQALHDLQKNGHFVAIATGRLQAEAIGFARNWAFPTSYPTVDTA